MGSEDGEDEYWENFREDLKKSRERSQDDFEKYLNIFGSGGLLVGLTLLSKLVESDIIYDFQWVLILGTILFVICLLSNLLSHYLAAHYNDCNIRDVDSKCSDIWDNFGKRNKKLININRFSIGSIILGTILITLFLILNINTMPDKNKISPEKPKTTQSNPKPLNEEKGRIPQKPSSEIKPKK